MQSKSHMKEFVVDLLNNNLPLYYYYHNYEHTLYVTEKAVEIGQAENCTEAEMKLLLAAALWHDSGYINTIAGHEEAGCVLAKQYLPDYGYDQTEINTICGMIMATKIPQSPKNKLEQIIADADLEYLGTDEAGGKADDFFKELQYLNPLMTSEEWNRTQISFLQSHQYFTPFCREYREPIKALYLSKLVNGIG